MKALFIFFRYPLYNQGSYFQEFINSISDNLDFVYLIASRYPRCNFKKPENVDILWVPYFKFKFIEDMVFMAAVLIKVIFNKKIKNVNVVNTIGPRGIFAGWYLKRKYKIPFVCTLEMLNEGTTLLGKLYCSFVRFFITKAPIDKIICWSDYYWQNYLKTWGVQQGKVAVIPAGINTEVFNSAIDGSAIKNKYGADKPLIVFAKPLYYQNTESAKLLVEACALLKERLKIKLLIGSGEGRKDVSQLAKSLGVEDSVDFMPENTPFTEIPQYLAASDIVVLPFKYAATTSRSLLEAMSCAKPVITTKVGEVELLFNDGKELILVDPKANDLAKAMELLLNNKELAFSLGRNACEIIKRSYSLKVIINQTMEEYKKIQ